MSYPTPMDVAQDEDRQMNDPVIEEILSRDYISATVCNRLAEVCLLRSQRVTGLEDFLLFQTLESLCKQAARYAQVFNNRQSGDSSDKSGSGDESGGQL